MCREEAAGKTADSALTHSLLLQAGQLSAMNLHTSPSNSGAWKGRHHLLTLKCFQRFPTLLPNKRQVNILGEPTSLFTGGMTGKFLNFIEGVFFFPLNWGIIIIFTPP